MTEKKPLDRTIVLELARVTEAAARAAVKHLGHGDKNAADGAAVEAMRTLLNTIDMKAVVAIGEGEKDNAPMLYVGEELGCGNAETPYLEIAVDPIDGTTIVSKGLENAISVIAVAEKGNFFSSPDTYHMEKLVVGPDMDINAFTLDMPMEEMVHIAAQQKNVPASHIVVCMLDRPRNQKYMDGVRAAGGRVKLISDGDVAGALAAALPDSDVDMLIGLGGAPEGVVTAAALKCLGGKMLARMCEKEGMPPIKTIGLSTQTLYTTEDLAKGDVMFAATGITNGSLVRGIHRKNGREITHTVVMRSKTKTVRWLESHYTVEAHS